MYFYNARYYDSYLNRFIQADTIVPSPANPQSLNRYSYVLNSPLRYTDPTGHAEWVGDDGGRGEDYWMEGLTPKAKVRAYEAYQHYQKDPAYFEKLYLQDPNNDELMYLSIYAEYHDRVYLESLMQINPPVLAAEAFTQLEGQVASGLIDTETAKKWALTYIGIMVLSDMLESAGTCANCGTNRPELARSSGRLRIDPDGTSVYCVNCLQNGLTNAKPGTYWVKSFDAYETEALEVNIGTPVYTGSAGDPGHFSVFKGGPTDTSTPLWQRLNQFIRSDKRNIPYPK